MEDLVWPHIQVVIEEEVVSGDAGGDEVPGDLVAPLLHLDSAAPVVLAGLDDAVDPGVVECHLGVPVIYLMGNDITQL